MTHLIQRPQIDFSITINSANSSLNLSQKQIREMFSKHTICLMDYIEKDIHENVIEIRFDNQNATITCTFDNTDKCNFVFIFLDDVNDMEHYITYLTDIYDYDFIQCRWILLNSYIKIKKTKDDTYLMVYTHI